jgi:uncharacterized protein involved in outer membrane biogenesis
MHPSSASARWRKPIRRGSIGLCIALGVLLTAVGVFQGHLGGWLIHYAEHKYQRQIQVSGALDVQLLSLHPQIVAEQVTIGNPPWTPPGTMAEIGRLAITYDLPWFGRPLALHCVEIGQASLKLLRDDQGHSNWQTRAPGSGPGPGPKLIHGLSMPNARVHLDDERRRLHFDGTLSAQDAPDGGPAPPLQIRGAGQLNGHDVQLALTGDSLATVTHERPYHFEFVESSSGGQLKARGVVPHPFDFRVQEASFEATGEDMKDLYFLTGLAMIDTGHYRLSGRFARQGRSYRFSDLQASSGQSDMHGSVSVVTIHAAPPRVEVELTSDLLRIADLGARAAGREPRDDNGKKHVLPDKALNLEWMRKRDTVVRFHANTLDAGRYAFRTVAAQVTISAGVMSVAPASAVLGDGKVRGEARLDVTRDVPEVNVDIQASNLPLNASLRGPVQGRVSLKGRGNSVHAWVSKADGKVTVVLPHGAMRSSIAELAGFDLRGLGQKVMAKHADTEVRCGVASFDVKDGLLTANRLLLDTEPVLITGEGTIDLESEALDLQLQGHPKEPRLRVRAPLLIHGPWKEPTYSMDMKKPALQAGGAVALGVLFTPLAAMLAFVDPGLTKDTNCVALLAQVRAAGK